MTRSPTAWALAFAFLFSALLLFPRLDVIPGLHGDEAWVGLRAHAILHGARPTTGMNAYTGPLYQFLLVPFVWGLGFTASALRSLTAVTAVITVVLYRRVMAQLFDPTTAAFAMLTLVTLPFFTAYGRLAGENFALNPLLAVAAIALLLDSSANLDSFNRLDSLSPARLDSVHGVHSVHSVHDVQKDSGSPRRRMLLSLASGLCLGAGTWNHAIFLTVPAALAATALYRHGRSLLRSPGAYAVGAGFLLALAPRLIIQAQMAGTSPVALPRGAAQLFWSGLRGRLIDWPPLFLQIAHGDILFRRFAGELRFATPDFTAPLAALGLIVLLARYWRYRDEAAARGLDAIVFGGVLFASTLAICPGNSDRYFLLLLYLVPLFVAAAFAQLHRLTSSKSSPESSSKSSSESSSKSSSKMFVWLTFCVFVAVQLDRVAINYFVSQEDSQGRSSVLLLGRQPETSSHYMRTDGLYRQLVSIGASDVRAEFFIAEPLLFYDLERGRFSSVSVHPAPGAERAPDIGPVDPDSYTVIYSTISTGRRRPLPERDRQIERVFEDSHFVVLHGRRSPR